MKHIKPFNENMQDDEMSAVLDSFNSIKNELQLLDKRIGWSRNEELNELKGDIMLIISQFNDIHNKFNEIKPRYFRAKIEGFDDEGTVDTDNDV